MALSSALRTRRSSVWGVRQQRAEEQHAVAAGEQEGGEVLDVEVADQLGLVLDVDPHEAGGGAGVAQAHGDARGDEGVAVGLAGAAPLGAQAGDEQR